jgi:ABC-type branched-subunit amino acid transport system substrate-binding protein
MNLYPARPYTATSLRWALRISGGLAILAIASSCVKAPPPPVPVPVVQQPTGPTQARPSHPLTGEQPGFLKLGNMSDDRPPVRVGILLPFTNGSASTRALAASMMKSAELALFDAHNPDILLVTADEGSTPQQAAAGTRTLLSEGAEVIIGPLFAQSATAAAPIARDHGVPIISFSTDTAVAGNGVFLLSFQAANEVHRIVSFAASRGHTGFAALVPNTLYGERVAEAFETDVKAAGGRVTDIEKFAPDGANVTAVAKAVADTKPDTILIAQGGNLLREIGPTLAANGAGNRQVQLLGTGLWDDPSITNEPMLAGGWFTAPAHESHRQFEARFHAQFGSNPPQLATLAFDAVSLVARLAGGQPYHRFTAAVITDPNGFAGVDGIFRFDPDGSSQRGLAILSVQPDGFRVVDHAPTTFQAPPS